MEFKRTFVIRKPDSTKNTSKLIHPNLKNGLEGKKCAHIIQRIPIPLNESKPW
jgi:hypothetical protein